MEKIDKKFQSRKFLFSLLIFFAACWFGHTKVFNGDNLERIFIWIGVSYGLFNAAPGIITVAKNNLPPKT